MTELLKIIFLNDAMNYALNYEKLNKVKKNFAYFFNTRKYKSARVMFAH